VIAFGVVKLEWWGYPVVKKTEDMFSRSDRILACAGQTGGQTDGGTDRHLATA